MSPITLNFNENPKLTKEPDIDQNDEQIWIWAKKAKNLKVSKKKGTIPTKTFPYLMNINTFDCDWKLANQVSTCTYLPVCTVPTYFFPFSQKSGAGIFFHFTVPMYHDHIMVPKYILCQVDE